MAYVCHGQCYTCGRLMSFNPHLVPSLPASMTSTGEKEPVCRQCIERANPERKKKGLPEITIPEGAYEPQSEATDTDFDPFKGT